MIDKNNIMQSLSSARTCQRNWDRHPINPDDIEYFKTVLEKSPKKQGRVFHHTVFIENPNIIDELYYNAKEEDEKIPHNGQMTAPLVVLFVPYDISILPSLEKEVTENFNAANKEKTNYIFGEQDINTSIGIHSGMLALIANQIGYKTGFCSCFNTSAKQIFRRVCENAMSRSFLDYDNTLALGIGYSRSNTPHNYDQLHDTLMYRHENVWDTELHFCHIK